MTTFLTPLELAVRIRLSIYSLRKMRAQGKGPVFTRLGHKTVLYSLSDVEDWEGRCRKNISSEEKSATNKEMKND